jgi:hypothetical protein
MAFSKGWANTGQGPALAEVYPARGEVQFASWGVAHRAARALGEGAVGVTEWGVHPPRVALSQRRGP